jgi:folate-binding protein YgfZ
MEKSYVALDGRALLAVAGADRAAFLQGLVSNDVTRASPTRAIHAALLTAQGKYLHDFFIAELGETLYLEAEAARLADLKRRLTMYKLRSKVSLAEAPDLAVVAAFGDGAAEALGLAAEPGAAAPFGGGIAFVDPRLARLGARLWLPADRIGGLRERGFAERPFADYDRLRLELGVPDGSRDLEIEKSILLESGFDELNGVDWQKGCYTGQELTARTKYRGLVKKRLLPVRIEGPAPAPGTVLMQGAKEAGEMRSSLGEHGLALVRLEALAGGEPLEAGGARLIPTKPDWAKL